MIVKLRVPTQKFIEKVGDTVPEQAAIIDRRLAAPRTPMPLQFCAAILAVRQRWTYLFRPTKQSRARSPFDCANRRVAKENFCGFIRHTVARLQKDFRCVDCV
jgi:hypothetical protein